MERIMKAIQNIMLVSAVAFSAIAFVTGTASSAKAGPIVPAGRSCLLYDEGGTDCSFTSYAQCEATASGLAAECYGSPVQGYADLEDPATKPLPAPIKSGRSKSAAGERHNTELQAAT